LKISNLGWKLSISNLMSSSNSTEDCVRMIKLSQRKIAAAPTLVRAARRRFWLGNDLHFHHNEVQCYIKCTLKRSKECINNEQGGSENAVWTRVMRIFDKNQSIKFGLLGAFHSFALTAITPAQRSLSQHCVIRLCNAESRLIFSILHYYFYCIANDLIKHHESSFKTCCFRVHTLAYTGHAYFYTRLSWYLL
jgi:hypothetical protein